LKSCTIQLFEKKKLHGLVIVQKQKLHG